MAKESPWVWAVLYVIVIAVYVRLTWKDKARILPFRDSSPLDREPWDMFLFSFMAFVAFPILVLISQVGTSSSATIALWSLLAIGIFLYYPGVFRVLYQEKPTEGPYRRGKEAFVFGMLMVMAAGFLGFSLEQVRFHLETPHRYEYLKVATDPVESPMGQWYITFEEYPDYKVYDWPLKKGETRKMLITDPQLLARK